MARTERLAAYAVVLGDSETLPEEEERNMLGALVAVSAGAEDVSKPGVPEGVGRRLLRWTPTP